ncbi:Testis-specific serine/threonine-protein kinase 4 [Mortierella sp. GBA39]|nr:Testis-specific serine/threonine-protein kinase 4 [Mortierella sp. GBA39]
MQKSSPSKSSRPSPTNIPAPVPMRPYGGSSWQGSRPDPDSTPAAPKGSALPNYISLRTMASPASTSTKPFPPKESPSPSASPSPTPHPHQSSGFKIRIPRDLPNIPDIFRNPDSARSKSSASPRSKSSTPYSPATSPNQRPTSVDAEPVYQQSLALTIQPVDNSKRTHSEMLSGETVPTKNFPIFDQRKNAGKKIKTDRSAPSPSVPVTLSPSVSKPVVPRASRSMSRSNSSQSLSSGAPPSPRKSPSKRNAAKSSVPQTNSDLPPIKLIFAADTAGPVVPDAVVKKESADVTMTAASPLKRHRSRSYTKSNSPAPAPAPTAVRLPTPMSINGGTSIGSLEPNHTASSPLPSTPKATTSCPFPTQPSVGTAPSTSHNSPSRSLVEATPSSSHHSSSCPLVEAASSSTSSSGNESSAPPASNDPSSEVRSVQLAKNLAPAGSSSDVHVTNSPPPPPTSIADAIEQNIRTNEALQLVRLGMSILDRLLSNPVSKSFINKVPLALTTYHTSIKRPMDLTTIEQKLWKAFVVQQQSLSQPMNPALLSTADHITFTTGYSKQAEFEQDLWQIYKNAVTFNPPSDNINKQATQFQLLYNGLLMAHRDGQLPIPRMPQEVYHTSMVSLDNPGALYLFRAQTFREMDRKLTDMATDLFVNFHQPLIDTMNNPEPMSSEKPRFARMYINKNRSLLGNCRDDPRARLAILSDLRVSKPFNDPAGGPNPIKVVHIKARVMLGKPIGERHDMITVGDLDCPCAWIVFAGIKTLDLDINVPTRFEKRMLSRIRHDVSPFVDTTLTADQERGFLEALGFRRTTAHGDEPAPSESAAASAPPQASSNPPVVPPTQPPVPTSNQSSPSVSTAIATRPMADRVEPNAWPSLPSPILPSSTPPSSTAAFSPTSTPMPTLAKLAATPINQGVPTEKPGSQELKRPFEESISESQDSATDMRHVGKRRPSLIANERNAAAAAAAAAATSAMQLNLKLASSHQAVQPNHIIRQAPHPSPAPVQPAPLAPPTVARPFDSTPAPVTIGQASQKSTASTSQTAIRDSPLTSPLVTTTMKSAPMIMSTPTSTLATPSTTGRVNEFEQGNLLTTGAGSTRALTDREEQMLRDIKVTAREKQVPYTSWKAIEPTLIADSAQGLFKRIYHVQGEEGLVIQNFKEMDTESFEQRVREVACLLKLRGLEGVGQIQSIIDDNEDHLVGLSMTKYAYTLKAYATNARRHPSPCQKLSLIRDMVAALSSIHGAGLAHRDLSEVNIMVDEDPLLKLEDNTPRPWVRVIDFGKSVFVEPEEVKRWSMNDHVSDEELALLPLVVLPPDHGYKLYRSILTLPRSKQDHTPLPPVDPRSEDVYSLGVLIWRTFSGKSPWNGAIEDDIKTIRYLISTDEQIKFQLEREVTGQRSRDLLLRCLTAEASTRSTIHQLRDWLEQPEVLAELLKEFETLGGGRKKVRKILD